MKNQNQINTNEGSENQNKNHNETVIFEAIAPHPEPVVVGELLTEIEAIIKRHVVLSDPAATALAVWVLHTYVYELRDTVAYVAIESPEKRCGKTTLLTVLGAMANKPLIASNVTVGALFRAIDTCRPTLLIDEADTFLAGNTTMRGVINSGNTWRTAYVLRMSKSKSQQGPEREGVERNNHTDSGLKRYSCWCPKVVAMIGRVPDTIADRSIVVHMSRKLTSEIRAPLAELNTDSIKAKCARFALDQRHIVAQCGKIRGEGLNDRAADTFDPLYVIARVAGKEWDEKLHAAALVLSPIAGSKSTAAELLLDIYAIFRSTDKKKIFTRQLVEHLRDEEFNVTSAALKDSTIDEQKIAQLLRPYGIKPSLCRIRTQVARGYCVEHFADAIARYVPEADLAARTEEIEQENKLFEEAEEIAAEREARNSGAVP
jgi:putative DNA primase/helicase